MLNLIKMCLHSLYTSYKKKLSLFIVKSPNFVSYELLAFCKSKFSCEFYECDKIYCQFSQIQDFFAF